MKYFLLLFHTLVFSFYALSQEISTSQLDSLINLKEFKEDEPGVSVFVLQKNELIYSKQIGLANLEKKISITDSTLFNFASITKQFTAFCILKLEQEGKLNTNDSIQKYIPELPDFGKTITLNHLLSHTSGIPDHFELLMLQGKYTRKSLTTEYLINHLNNNNYLSFTPGNMFAYSNSGYMLLKEIIERVSEQTMKFYLQENIFEPLNMESARFEFYEENALVDLTTSYFKTNNKYKHYAKPQASALGATGLYGSLYDFMKWDNLFYKSDKRFESIIQRMKKPFYLKNRTKIGYGMGIILKPYNGYLSEEHSGGWNNFLLQFRRFPELGISILVASNNYEISPFSICDDISNVVAPKENGKYSELTIKKLELKELKKLRGTYIDASNVLIRVNLINENLVITNIDSSVITQNLTFLEKDQDIITFKDENNNILSFNCMEIDHVILSWRAGNYFNFVRYYNKLLNQSSEINKSWTGKYKSEALNYKFRIVQNKKNKLILKPYFFLKYKLENIGDNVFKVKNQSVFLRFYDYKVSVGNLWISNLELQKRN